MRRTAAFFVLLALPMACGGLSSGGTGDRSEGGHGSLDVDDEGEPAAGEPGASGGHAATSGAGVAVAAGAGQDPEQAPDEPQADWLCARTHVGSGIIVPTPTGSLDVWSDARGPFVLAGSAGGYSIFHRSAAGWIEHATETAGDEDILLGSGSYLTGIPGGPLLLYGEVACGLRWVEDGASRCATAASGVRDAYIVDAEHLYALSGDRVLVYDDPHWVQLGPPLPRNRHGSIAGGLSIWADSERIAVITASRELFVSDEQGAFEVKNAPITSDFGALTGLPGGDIWIGARSGALISHDGETATERARLEDPCGERDRVEGLWAGDGVVYAHTAHQLSRSSGDAFEVVHEWPCSERIWAIWGNHASEVYVVTSGAERAGDGCGSVAAYLYDGENVRRL